MKLYRCFFKPLIDILIASIGLILSLPFTIPVSVLLASDNSGNPFFIQSRPGKNAKVFRIVKFKTMNDSKDAHGELLPDAERLTTVGRWVRKTSLDELPQLINVLKGDMSLVGPRPLLVEYLPLYTVEQARRHEVKPGITGWAQVNGRNAISWEEKFQLDVWYVEHQSFWLDLKILWMTVLKVVKKEDINQDGQATVQNFKGNEQ
jgi:lipopolysaccharide/colanic/teichoic acid biosynthesis glycosyltransferase